MTPVRTTTERVPPSPQQEALWFLHRLDPTDPAYHVGFALEIDGPLDEAALAAAIEDLAASQEALRTGIGERGGRPVLVFGPSPRLAIAEPGADVEARLDALLHAPFDLAAPPLARFELVRPGPGKAVLGCVFHHVVFDGASVALCIEQLLAAYAARVGPPGEHGLASAPGVLAELGRAQRAVEAGAAWSDALGDAEPLVLPADRPRRGSGGPGRTDVRRLPDSVAPAVERLARSSGATPFMVLLAAFFVLVARQAGSVDPMVGTPISMRMDRRLRDRIGMLVNTAALRAPLGDNPSFAAYLERVKQACLHAYRHNRIPFSRVLDALRPDRGLGGSPLFTVMFILQSAPAVPPVAGLSIRHRELSPRGAKFDLTGAVAVGPGGWELSLEHRTDLFSEETIRSLSDRYLALLEAALEDPGAGVFDLGFGSLEAESKSHGGPHPEEGALVSVVEQLTALAQAAPERLAVEEPCRTVTLGELLDRAERFAAGLVGRGVGLGDRVGLRMGPGADALAAALGCSKIGAAYVPVDPGWPPNRARALVEDAGPKVVVGPPGGFAPGRDLSFEEVDSPPIPFLPVPLSAVAYVIYTSGSTGTPKGVEITQESLARFLGGFRAALGFGASPRWVALASFAFDISVLELYAPLLDGGVAVVAPAELGRDGPGLSAWLDGAEPTVLQTTPTRWRMLLAAGWAGRRGLTALTGGEVLTVDLARALLHRADRVVNLYGPTEGTVWSTWHEVCPASLDGRDPREGLSLGRPIPGVGLELVDTRGAPVPMGVPGEIVLVGPMVGRGYLGRPEKTAQAFRVRPDGARTYATGDRARYRPDQSLEFLGRGDAQVKVRGHRIELGEIESVLRRIPGVKEAAAVVRDDTLYGFVETSGPVEEDFRGLAAAELPEPMVPAAVVVLPRLPRTPSGKLDRRALPEVETAGPVRLPTTELERQIAAVWEEALGRRPIGVDSDFFALGGQSVLAVEVVARLGEALGRPVSVVELLAGRTPAGLAARLAARLADRTEPNLPLDTLVVHRKSGGARPLFIIDVGHMMPGLLHHLHREIPLYALNLFGLVPLSGPIPEPSVADVAGAFRRDLQKVQPRGPYRLLAHCGDVKIALELARQLKDRGEAIEFFGAVDVIGPAGTGQLDPRQVLGLLRDFGLSYPKGVLRRWKTRTTRLILRRAAVAAARIERVRPLGTRERHDVFYDRFLDKLSAHDPPRLGGPAVLLVGTEYHRRTTPEALRALVGPGSRIIEVPGFHESLFEPPWVAAMGAAVSKALLEPPGA